jgi:hypothetical protein
MSRLTGRRLGDQLGNIPLGVALNNMPEMLTPESPKAPESILVSPQRKN